MRGRTDRPGLRQFPETSRPLTVPKILLFLVFTPLTDTEGIGPWRVELMVCDERAADTACSEHPLVVAEQEGKRRQWPRCAAVPPGFTAVGRA